MSLFKTLKNIGTVSYYKMKGEKELGAKYLANVLGDQKGIWLKFAQMLGTSKDAFEDLTMLAESKNIEPIPISELKEYIIAALPDLNLESMNINPVGIPASLSQVHLCNEQGREPSVLKIKYPNIENIISDQLKKIGWLKAVEYVNKDPKKNFEITQYLESIKNMIEKELDYFHEIDNMNKFHKYNNKRTGVTYPRPSEQYFSNDAYVMTLVNGVAVSNYIDSASEEQKRNLAQESLKLFLSQLLIDGFFQGDSHLGNFLVDDSENLGFIDFGHFIELNDQERLAIYSLIKAKIEKKDINLGPMLFALGFDLEKLSLIKNKIPLLFDHLLYPFGLNYALNINKWTPKSDIELILADDKWWFRTSGSSRFFLIIRSLFGMYNFLKRLDGEIFFKKVFLDIEKDIAFDGVQLPDKQLAGASFEAIAKNLRVQVYENNIIKVDLTMPALSFLNIEDFISDDVKDAMVKNFVDVSQLKRIYLSRGLPKSKVIDQSLENKRYLVWLE